MMPLRIAVFICAEFVLMTARLEVAELVMPYKLQASSCFGTGSVIFVINRLNTQNLRLRLFENKVLRRIFGLRRDEVTGDWRRLHNEEINVLYSSPIIVRVIKSRRMR